MKFILYFGTDLYSTPASDNEASGLQLWITEACKLF
jgi:hypothetical protein